MVIIRNILLVALVRTAANANGRADSISHANKRSPWLTTVKSTAQHFAEHGAESQGVGSRPSTSVQELGCC